MVYTFERTYFDVRVFNPHAPSSRHTNPQSVYGKHEQVKKRAYEQHAREIEHATFSPLVLSATDGLAQETNTFYKRLTSMLASKWDHSYSNTLCWLCCCLTFSHPSSQSEVQGRHVVIPSGSQQRLTWLTLHHTFCPCNLLTVLLLCIYFSSAVSFLLLFPLLHCCYVVLLKKFFCDIKKRVSCCRRISVCLQ